MSNYEFVAFVLPALHAAASVHQFCFKELESFTDVAESTASTE